ncbi:DNA-binding protein inhibitor ID-3 [Corythoichthys intestinalis]|uniref:DNA-binding protein inhibitor ID-3 n=1 Tax=Corythoichthys intestinalis TaxID=161448 RepID=UPI0025A558CD|nr:DNA-binding protein inhibitor ID-3 [Corythoichthys intestinalis]XP_061799032.1 DNA-binding protein inhibitor ID-3-like [Nerophis lumbriciformis]
MKAISPVRSGRSCYKAVCCISERSVAIGRTTKQQQHACVEVPPGDMNDCYSRLAALVPSIPRNKSVSQVEILQHVIDYIFDLQIALEAEETPRLLSIKTADLTRTFSKDEGRLCH